MISNKTQKPQWTRLQRALAWLSFGVFFFGFVLYMFGYTGNSWYVSPVVNNQYPPDNPIDPIHFGLFYLCFRGHCKYDLRQDYQIVGLIPEELGITWAYQNYRTICMVVVTIGAILSLLAFGCYLWFLSHLPLSLIVGYVTAALQILSAIISLIGVGMFAQHFYGSVGVSPFGSSFALTIVGVLFFFFNGVFLVVHTVFIHRYLCSARAGARGRTRPAGFFGFFQDCMGTA